MDLKVSLALGTVFYFFCFANAAPIDYRSQYSARNFIPNRFRIKGTLINDDGTMSRQDPPDENPSNSESSYSQTPGSEYGQATYPAAYGYPSYAGYPPAAYPGYYGAGAYGHYHDDMQSDRSSNYEEKSNDYSSNEKSSAPWSSYAQNDEVTGQGQEAQYYTQPSDASQMASDDAQQYYGQQFTPESREAQGYYGNAEMTEQSYARDQQEAQQNGEQRFKIPHLKPKDLQGLLGYAKQPYLRGGQ